MTKGKKIGQCVLCGKTREVTREHVPPKNLFLAPRPGNTITVPVCKPCNHGYHLDDEYFRVYVASGADPGTRQARLWNEKVVGSSFARSKGLKGRLNDDHETIVLHHQNVEPLLTFDDSIVADELVPFTQPFDAARIDAVVEKIVRCLHFSLSQKPLSSTASVVIDNFPLADSDLHTLFEKRSGHVGNHDEFIFQCEKIDAINWRWLLAFYVVHTFSVRVISPLLPQAHQTHSTQGEHEMISNFSIESCKKFYVIEKTVEAAVDIAGEPEIIRIEALQSLPDRMYSARSFIQMPVTIQPTYPQTHGKFDHKPQEVRIWVDFDLPSANGQNVDDVLNLALNFLRERCSS